MYTAMRIAKPCWGCVSIQQFRASKLSTRFSKIIFLIFLFFFLILKNVASAALLVMDDRVS